MDFLSHTQNQQLLTLYSSYRTCSRCRFGQKRVNLLEGVGNDSSPVMVLIDKPSIEAVTAGRSALGGTGDPNRSVMEMLLSGSGKNLGDLWYTTTVLCPTISAAEARDTRAELAPSPKAAELKACRDRLSAEILAVGPEIVIAYGSAAVTQLFPRDTPNVVYHTGEVHEATITGVITPFKVPVMLAPSLLSLFLSTDMSETGTWRRAHDATMRAITAGYAMREMRTVRR